MSPYVNVGSLHVVILQSKLMKNRISLGLEQLDLDSLMLMFANKTTTQDC